MTKCVVQLWPIFGPRVCDKVCCPTLAHFWTTRMSQSVLVHFWTIFGPRVCHNVCWSVPTPPPSPSLWTGRRPDVTVPSKASPRHLRGPWAGVGPTSHFLQAPPRVRRQAPGGGRPDVTFPSEAPWARPPRKDFLPQALARARGRRRSARRKKSLPQWGCKFENPFFSIGFSI